MVSVVPNHVQNDAAIDVVLGRVLALHMDADAAVVDVSQGLEIEHLVPTGRQPRLDGSCLFVELQRVCRQLSDGSVAGEGLDGDRVVLPRKTATVEPEHVTVNDEYDFSVDVDGRCLGHLGKELTIVSKRNDGRVPREQGPGELERHEAAGAEPPELGASVGKDFVQQPNQEEQEGFERLCGFRLLQGAVPGHNVVVAKVQLRERVREGRVLAGVEVDVLLLEDFRQGGHEQRVLDLNLVVAEAEAARDDGLFQVLDLVDLDGDAVLGLGCALAQLPGRVVDPVVLVIVAAGPLVESLHRRAGPELAIPAAGDNRAARGGRFLGGIVLFETVLARLGREVRQSLLAAVGEVLQLVPPLPRLLGNFPAAQVDQRHREPESLVDSGGGGARWVGVLWLRGDEKTQQGYHAAMRLGSRGRDGKKNQKGEGANRDGLAKSINSWQYLFSPLMAHLQASCFPAACSPPGI